jgi:hypothetical protein
LYQNGPIAQEVSAIDFGAIEAKGKLPVTVTANFTNSGLSTEKLNVLGFTAAENGMKPLIKIEPIAQKAIDGKMAPGMQRFSGKKRKSFIRSRLIPDL